MAILSFTVNPKLHSFHGTIEKPIVPEKGYKVRCLLGLLRILKSVNSEQSARIRDSDRFSWRTLIARILWKTGEVRKPRLLRLVMLYSHTKGDCCE